MTVASLNQPLVLTKREWTAVINALDFMDEQLHGEELHKTSLLMQRRMHFLLASYAKHQKKLLLLNDTLCCRANQLSCLHS